jgi:16S rRNA (guanine527-N7)-methyltransferase
VSSFEPERIRQAFLDAGLTSLPDRSFERFSRYLALLLSWNQRLNLTAIRDVEQIVHRHFLECAFGAQYLPHDIGGLLDFGSGAGLPGIPFAICRPDLKVTLAESQGKKAAFLREAARKLELPIEVYAGRVEAMPQARAFDAVAMRAVDRMKHALEAAKVRARKYLVVFTASEFARDLAVLIPEMEWREAVALPESEERVMAIGRRISGSFEAPVPRGIQALS